MKKNKCTCGAHAVDSNYHSEWCDHLLPFVEPLSDSQWLSYENIIVKAYNGSFKDWKVDVDDSHKQHLDVAKRYYTTDRIIGIDPGRVPMDVDDETDDEDVAT